MIQDAFSSSEDERETELSSITAIFPETVIDPENPFSVSIEIPVTSDKPIPIASLPSSVGTAATTLPTPPASDDDGGIEDLAREASTAHGERVSQDLRYVTNLPPLSLRVTLPKGYPEEKPPIVDLTSSPPWLPDAIIQRLAGEAVSLWEELGRSPVIFTFIDHLQQAAERVFDLVGDGADPIRVDTDVRIALVDFDTKSKREKFERETFECGVCLSPKKGSSCHRMLLCGHVFCIQCLQDFYNSCITEGDVASVKCLDPGCGKDGDAAVAAMDPASSNGKRKRRKVDRTLGPNELLEIPLGQETVHRYVELKRKARLESDKNVIYCPRKWCQGPARWKRSRHDDAAASDEDESDDDGPSKRSWKMGDPEEEMPPPSERVAICEDCSYAFCRVCLAGWHGELKRCWPRKAAELDAEEQATENYLKEYSSCCPTCNARCQKTMGCNHMICFKCRTHFCYLCGSWLDERNPYQHYNNPNLGCHMKLWVLEAGDGLDVPQRQMNNELEWDSEDDEPQEAPPPAPEPPRRGQDQGGRAPAANIRAPLAAQHEAVNLPPAPDRPLDRRHHEEAPVNILHNWRPGRLQGRRGGGGPGAGQFPDLQGLRHFLDMVNNDEEDEWDSDELGEEGDHGVDWEIPVR